jgi:hypothetical protein
MHYYDHYHDPNTHLQLTRQHDDEFLKTAKRPKIRLSLLARLRTLLRGAVPARPAPEKVTNPPEARDATRARRRPKRDPKPMRSRPRAARARPPI